MKGKDPRLDMIRSGLRLNTKAPRIETPRKIYNRKTKHKKQEKPDD